MRMGNLIEISILSIIHAFYACTYQNGLIVKRDLLVGDQSICLLFHIHPIDAGNQLFVQMIGQDCLRLFRKIHLNCSLLMFIPVLYVSIHIQSNSNKPSAVASPSSDITFGFLKHCSRCTIPAGHIVVLKVLHTGSTVEFILSSIQTSSTSV